MWVPRGRTLNPTHEMKLWPLDFKPPSLTLGLASLAVEHADMQLCSWALPSPGSTATVCEMSTVNDLPSRSFTPSNQPYNTSSTQIVCGFSLYSNVFPSCQALASGPYVINSTHRTSFNTRAIFFPHNRSTFTRLRRQPPQSRDRTIGGRQYALRLGYGHLPHEAIP